MSVSVSGWVELVETGRSEGSRSVVKGGSGTETGRVYSMSCLRKYDLEQQMIRIVGLTCPQISSINWPMLRAVVRTAG